MLNLTTSFVIFISICCKISRLVFCLTSIKCRISFPYGVVSHLNFPKINNKISLFGMRCTSKANCCYWLEHTLPLSFNLSPFSLTFYSSLLLNLTLICSWILFLLNFPSICWWISLQFAVESNLILELSRSSVLCFICSISPKCGVESHLDMALNLNSISCWISFLFAGVSHNNWVVESRFN